MVFFSRDSQVGVAKFSKFSKFPQLWGCITSCADLRLQWGLKQSCSLRQELSNGMSHASCTWRNWVDYWLLMVGSQIANLTPDLSFDHNLCFKCPNGRCEFILDIYVSISFSNDIKNSSSRWVLTPAIALWIFRSPFGTRTPTMGVHLRVWGVIPSHSLLSHSLHSENMWCDSWIFLLAHNLETPCLGHEPKAKVTTTPHHFISYTASFHDEKNVIINATLCSFKTSFCNAKMFKQSHV
jgi:hypothetical protein